MNFVIIFAVPAYCNPSKHGPVCDNSGVQHSNLCSLLRTARGSSQLGYRGHCQHGCEHTTSVCGVNGETYMTECAALADHMAVDYHDSCHTHPNAICEYKLCDSPRGMSLSYPQIKENLTSRHEEIQFSIDMID